MSFPIGSFADATPTGSINGASTLLTRDLDQEDWRRAKAAMEVALDPQGNGDSVPWANPATGAKGSFAAAAPPFPKHDKVCRAFLAHVLSDGRTERRVQGSACRDGTGNWAIADAEQLDKGKAVSGS